MIRNVIILGSGRSGTSMVAGTLAKSGYYMGSNLLPPGSSNPKGFFEDVEINSINEALLALVLPNRPPVIGRWFFRHRPLPYQRWVSCLPVGKRICSSSSIDERIRAAIQRIPYCFKDPRFCYTLPAWRHFLRNEIYVCVFRHPTITARSILKECRDDPRLHNLSIDYERALQVWYLMYKHILGVHRSAGQWLFLHYNQLFTRAGLDRLRLFTGATVDQTFPDRNLQRFVSEERVPPKYQDVYDTLCKLSRS